MSARCDAELCPYWNGDDCLCEVFDIKKPGPGADPAALPSTTYTRTLPSFDDPCTPGACCESGQACDHHAPLHGRSDRPS